MSATHSHPERRVQITWWVHNHVSIKFKNFLSDYYKVECLWTSLIPKCTSTGNKAFTFFYLAAFWEARVMFVFRWTDNISNRFWHAFQFDFAFSSNDLNLSSEMQIIFLSFRRLPNQNQTTLICSTSLILTETLFFLWSRL